MEKMDWEQWKQTLTLSLNKKLPGTTAHKKMLPLNRLETTLEIENNAKQSAVMIILFPDEYQKLSLVLIERTKDGGVHSGQIALPGGKVETYDRSLLDAAIRETVEEVALSKETFQVIGQLSPLYIKVSNFLVNPFIAFCDNPPTLKKSDHEVTEIYTTDLNLLLHSKSIIPIAALDKLWQAPVYQLPNKINVWGATAMILSELEMILLDAKLL